jgi:hypothetical protein
VVSSAWVRSDPILLERIVLNLVSNAARYTASGSVVVGCRRRGDTVHIEVWDSGPGIPEDQRRNIFGEFYRLAGDNTQGGLGLGLAVVDRICNLLGHPIQLVSTVGKGSRFSVTVPMAAARAQIAEPAQVAIDALRMLACKEVAATRRRASRHVGRKSSGTEVANHRDCVFPISRIGAAAAGHAAAGQGWPSFCTLPPCEQLFPGRIDPHRPALDADVGAAPSG